MTQDDVLSAAIAVVSRRGLEGLTLRPLAEQAGVTVSALSHQFGQKSDLLALICKAGAAREQAVLDLWRTRIGNRAKLRPDQLAAVVDGVLDELSLRHAGLMQLHGELLQAAARHAELRPHFGIWLDLRRAFWAELVAASEIPGDYDLAAALDAYALDELGHGVALGGDHAYRWLRRLCIGRLCGGVLAPDASPSWEEESFRAVQAQLSDGGPALDRYSVAPLSATARTAAGHVARILLSEGADGITYRAVAKQAGVAASSLVYHFPRQEDLLRAGLEDIIRQAHERLDEGRVDGARVGGGDRSNGQTPTSHAPTLAAATHRLALAATRYPDLRPIVADMRRRRGENGLDHLRSQGPVSPRIDGLGMQVVSVAAMGALLLSRSRGEETTPRVMSELIALCLARPA